MLIGLAAGLQVAVMLISQLQWLGNYVLHTQMGEKLTLDFRSRLFRHVQRLAFTLPPGQLRKASSAACLRRLIRTTFSRLR